MAYGERITQGNVQNEKYNPLENDAYRTLLGAHMLHILAAYKDAQIPVDMTMLEKFRAVITSFMHASEACDIQPVVSKGEAIEISGVEDKNFRVRVKYAQYHSFKGYEKPVDAYEAVWVDFIHIPEGRRSHEALAALPSFVSRRKVGEKKLAPSKFIHADKTEQRIPSRMQFQEFSAITRVLQDASAYLRS